MLILRRNWCLEVQSLAGDRVDRVAGIVNGTTNFILSAMDETGADYSEMLAEATPIFATAWWFFLFPGLALLLTVLAFNLLGDGIRDALDPKAA